MCTQQVVFICEKVTFNVNKGFVNDILIFPWDHCQCILFQKLQFRIFIDPGPDARNFLKNVKIRMIYERWFFVTTEIINQICLVLQTLKHQNVSNWFIGGFVHVQWTQLYYLQAKRGFKFFLHNIEKLNVNPLFHFTSV